MEYTLENAMEIIRAVKGKFKEVCGTQFFHRDFTYGEETHVLKNYGDNLATELSLENRSKFKVRHHRPRNEFLPIASLFSKDAMAFNLFGNKMAEILKNEYFPEGKYKVEYRHMLSKSGGSTYQSPVTTEAKLTNARTGNIVFLNFDFFDWMFFGFKNLRAPYLDASRYGANGEVFKKAFSELVENSDMAKTEYIPKDKSLNSLFLIKQTATLYEYVCEEMFPGVTRIDIVLSNWHITGEETLSDSALDEYNNKKELFNREWEGFLKTAEPIKELFKEKGIELNFHFIPYCEFGSIVDMNKKMFRFFKRYFV